MEGREDLVRETETSESSLPSGMEGRESNPSGRSDKMSAIEDSLKMEKEHSDISRRLDDFERDQLALRDDMRRYEESLRQTLIIQKEISRVYRKQVHDLSALDDRLHHLLRPTAEAVTVADGTQERPRKHGAWTWLGRGAIGRHESQGHPSVSGLEDADLAEQNRARLKLAHRSLTRSGENVPKYLTPFLRMFLGNISLILPSMSDRIAYKKSCHSFMTVYFWLNIVLTIVLIFSQSRFLIGIYNLLWLYFYVALSLREHVQKINGSNIIRWWMIHHEVSILVTMFMVLWPYGDSFLYFFHYFKWFSLYNGLVLFLVHWYQQKKLYILIATEKAGLMDGVNSTAMMRALAYMIPFLISGYVWQVFMSMVLFQIFWRHPVFDAWQALVCGSLFFVLGVGNIVTTLWSYFIPTIKNLRRLAQAAKAASDSVMDSVEL